MAEWYAQQRLEDLRVYKLICCWVSEVPSFEELFPQWADSETEATDDGDSSFRAVTAHLSQYN